jgi:uncharacterized protein (TIGR02001 family)
MHRWFMPLLCALVALPALAATPQWSGSITASSNYLLRGTSRNYNDPALSTEIHAQFSRGVFASLWASSTRLRYGAETTAELAATLGYAGRVTDEWSWVGSFTHYETPWSGSAAAYRYNEFTLDFDWREHLLLSVSWSPDTSRYAPAFGFINNRNAWAWEAGYQQEVHRNLRAYAGVGYYDLSDLFGSGYWYGSLGLGLTWRRWQLDTSYVLPADAARRLSYPGAAKRRVVASVGFNF